ncbi:RNA helicase [Lithospermum erythrorhizon]|uniref:ATP-dependent RNA helicase n=1 Tax=Lithospermum erythrorhizon TaxID=34254 RepID=A0AAV3RDK3_LITER
MDGGRDTRSGFEMERRGGRSDMGRGGMRRGENGGREMRGGRRDMGKGNGGREMRGGRSDMGQGGVRSGENGGREMRGGRSNMGRGGVRSGVNVGREMRGGRSSMGRGDRRRGFGLSGDDEDETDDDNKGFKSFKELVGSDEDEEEEDSESDEEGEEVDSDLINKESVLAWRQNKDVERTSPPSSPSGGGESYLTETRFDQFSVSPSTLKALKDVGYDKMTVVQEATLPVILKGKDVLAKARTGTGKTVAFLLPSIEVVEKTPAASRDQKRPPILVLVICPTRELACQAAAEANKLLKYHPSLGVQVVIGGTRLSLEQKRMQANPCQILVATPGRLKDHIENTAGFATRLTGIKVLVLDEADHLLDMGFRKDIERIIAAVPKQRQTLLFSATIPPEVRQICHIALKRDHEYINTVQEGSDETHTQVQQTHLVATLDNHFSFLYTLLKDHIADNVDYKVLVFCTTAMITKLIAELLGELNLNVREIHSRKSQSYRTKVSDEFRKSKGLILVTSDVSARGVDYPDVSLVVQLGVPADRQQYIHRLGRTGRKGKEGQGVLLLAPWEEFFLSTLKDLPITKAPIPLVDPENKKKVERSLSRVGMKEKESAYQAWLGYYNSNKNIGKDKYRLVELANEFSRTMGLDSPPAIPKMILGKMGLKNIPGLRSK